MEVEELNEERKRQKLSVAELAEKANLPKGTVEKVLFGVVKNPRIDTMQAIERALGINEKSSPDGQESVKIPDSLKPYQYAFFDGVDGLTDESMKDILKYIEFVKEKENKEKK